MDQCPLLWGWPASSHWMLQAPSMKHHWDRPSPLATERRVALGCSITEAQSSVTLRRLLLGQSCTDHPIHAMHYCPSSVPQRSALSKDA